MTEQIDKLISETRDIIQSEMNSTTPEYSALDRLCGAVELMNQELKTKPWDVIREQENANDKARELYNAACSLMRHRNVKNDDQWQNLENAAMRYNAARQADL